MTKKTQNLDGVSAKVQSRVQVYLLRNAVYRGAHYGVGRVIRVDADTAKTWIADGTAKPIETAAAPVKETAVISDAEKSTE